MSIETLLTEYLCPCRSQHYFNDCCRLYLGGLRDAPTAEALVRSRFSARLRQDHPYLLHSWHPKTRPANVAPLPHLECLDFEILHIEYNAAKTRCVIETSIQLRNGNETRVLHEISYLAQEDNQWLFVYGEIEHWDGLQRVAARS